MGYFGWCFSRIFRVYKDDTRPDIDVGIWGVNFDMDVYYTGASLQYTRGSRYL